MPSKGTTIRNIRVTGELWDAAKAKAKSDGVSVSDIIRAALEAYVDAPVDKVAMPVNSS